MKKIIRNGELRLFVDARKSGVKETDLTKFYNGFKAAIREVKLYSEGKIELKDADKWLAEL